MVKVYRVETPGACGDVGFRDGYLDKRASSPCLYAVIAANGHTEAGFRVLAQRKGWRVNLLD